MNTVKQFRSKQDTTFLQILADLARLRFDIFTENMILEKKDQVKLNCIKFTERFVAYSDLKSILKAIRYDVPKLLGFQGANIYMYEEDKDNLYALQIDEDAEKRARESAIYSFANEHAFTENQVVRFPSTMGVNGFSFQTNSVAYFAKGKDLLKPKKQFCSLYSVNMMLVPEETQEATGHHLTKEFPFNVKSDNFLGLSSIQNLVVAAMTDEEQMGTEKPVGTF